jgi:hypothetical protein
MRENIEFPEYQREPNVWDSRKKGQLINSIINDIPIPLIFLFKHDNDRGKNVSYDCVDGRQRLSSIFEFFGGEVKASKYGDIEHIENTDPQIIRKIENYEIPVVIIESAKDEELREMFIRLQLGAQLNAGEKLHAVTGEMRDFVFNSMKDYKFIQNVRIPKRRYAREQVCAQICINSFYLTSSGKYKSARYENLLAFFEQFKKLSGNQEEINLIKTTLDLLHDSFGKEADELTNRALILTAYLFVENLVRNDKKSEAKEFSEFFLAFIKKLNLEVAKGLDYDTNYRGLIRFNTYVIHSAFEPTYVELRNKILNEYFLYWKRQHKIKTD